MKSYTSLDKVNLKNNLLRQSDYGYQTSSLMRHDASIPQNLPSLKTGQILAERRQSNSSQGSRSLYGKTGGSKRPQTGVGHKKGFTVTGDHFSAS